MVSRREWYKRVNETWPDGTLPALTADEAIRATRKLWRFALGETLFDVTMTSGRNQTRMSIPSSNHLAGGLSTAIVNPDKGWKDLVHSLSHWAHYRRVRRGDFLNYTPSNHSADHAMMERRMIKVVLRRGWLDGKLKTPAKAPPPPNGQDAEKLQRLQARIESWKRKARRAENALKKLRKQVRYYERKAEKPPAVSAIPVQQEAAARG